MQKDVALCLSGAAALLMEHWRHASSIGVVATAVSSRMRLRTDQSFNLENTDIGDLKGEISKGAILAIQQTTSQTLETK